MSASGTFVIAQPGVDQAEPVGGIARRVGYAEPSTSRRLLQRTAGQGPRGGARGSADKPRQALSGDAAAGLRVLSGRGGRRADDPKCRKSTASGQPPLARLVSAISTGRATDWTMASGLR